MKNARRKAHLFAPEQEKPGWTPTFEPHPEFAEFSDARLYAYQDLLQAEIDDVSKDGNKERTNWLECRMHLLQAERARRNGTKVVDSSKEQLIVTMDAIPREKVDWLWHGRIPLGYLTTVDGDPGIGKSKLTRKIAAFGPLVMDKPWPESTSRLSQGIPTQYDYNDGEVDDAPPHRRDFHGITRFSWGGEDED